MFFDLENSIIFPAVRIRRSFPPGLIKFGAWLLLIFVLLLLCSWVVDISLVFSTREQNFGLFVFFLSLDVLFWLWLLFFETKLKKSSPRPSLNEIIQQTDGARGVNLADYLEFEVAFALSKAASFAKWRKMYPLPFPVILLFIAEDERMDFIFKRMNIDKRELAKDIKRILKEFSKGEEKRLYNQEFLNLVWDAGLAAVSRFNQRITLGDIFVSLSYHDPFLRKVMFEKDLEAEDVANITFWEEMIRESKEKAKRFWEFGNLMARGGIGKGWAAGYTPNLDRYSTDITEILKKRKLVPHRIGRKREIELIERILSRRAENNVLLVGNPGVGRKAVAYSFARKIARGESLPNLNYKRVVELDIQGLLAGLKTPGEILERLRRVLLEALKARNIILIIDGLHNFIGAEPGAGTLDVAEVILPFLSSPGFQLIGATSYEGLHRNIERNQAVLENMEKVEIKEPTRAETILILEDIVPEYEKHYNLFVTYRAIREIVDLADRYIQITPFPEKAVDILEEVLVYTATKTDSRLVLSEHAKTIVSQKTEIPLGEVKMEERERLLRLEEIIHKRIINQGEAVNVISDAMRRARAGIRKREKPIGTFLFLGPTGVGKTETSKALAEAYFGSEKRMIRFDMSEYQVVDSIDRFIGSPDGKIKGQLTTAVLEDPFSLVLLDEIEKSHSNILNLFLQVLDEGHLTDSLGRMVSFKETIIIGTSNAGAEFIRQYIKTKKEISLLKDELLEHLQRTGIFKPEFLNRFDAVVVFKPLGEKELVEIARLLLGNLARRFEEERDIQFIPTPELAEKIAQLGYEPQFGARPMRRVIQDKIESKLARKILSGEIGRGDVIEIGPGDIE